MKDIEISIKVRSGKKEYDVKLSGDRQLFATKLDLENGMEPFKDISIVKTRLPSLNSALAASNSGEDNSESESNGLASDEQTETSSDSSSSSSTLEDSPKFSKCEIKISPQRNLMMPTKNNEKVMFLQNLLDEFGFKFEEKLDTVLVSGVQNMENYETFLRRLTYVIVGVNDVVEESRLNYIKSKKFLLSCTRVDPTVDTNSILIQVCII
jgi:hypothetical protein